MSFSHNKSNNINMNKLESTHQNITPEYIKINKTDTDKRS